MTFACGQSVKPPSVSNNDQNNRKQGKDMHRCGHLTFSIAFESSHSRATQHDFCGVRQRPVPESHHRRKKFRTKAGGLP